MSSSYDTLIIGGGLTGLVLAHRLHHAGQRIALLDARETLGGSSRRQSTVEFFPGTDANIELLEWARSISPVPLHVSSREHRPQVYDEGKWRAFSGFGETAFASVGELGHLSHPHEVVLDPGAEQLVRALAEQLPIAPSTLNEVTGLTIADGRVASVSVNGDRTLEAENVIFTAHPALLHTFIEGDGLPAKHRTRLAKMQGWTSVTLELHHQTPLVEDDSVRVFVHNAKEFEPVVGRVFGERSIWMTLVPFEKDSEHEFVGQCIRHIKRQLKRAWPEALEGQHEDRIYVQANAYGQYSLKTRHGLVLPEIANLYIANHALGTSTGTLGSLEVARTAETLLIGEARTSRSASAELPTLEN